MTDPLEDLRRARLAQINAHPRTRAELEAIYGKVWDTGELARDFEILGFLAPFVVVRRRSDGRTGSLEFQHCPRWYYGFEIERS